MIIIVEFLVTVDLLILSGFLLISSSDIICPTYLTLLLKRSPWSSGSMLDHRSLPPNFRISAWAYLHEGCFTPSTERVEFC